jgi:serine protease Do
MNKTWKLLGLAVAALALFAGLALAKSDAGRSAWLGVYTQSVTDEIATSYKLPVQYGVVVDDVVEDSPAEEAGLKEDDIIISFNGAKVADASDLTDLVADQKPGDKVTLKIYRDGKEQTLEATLSSRRSSNKQVFTFTTPRSGSHAYWYGDSDRKQSYIGVSLTELSDQLAEYFGATRNGGVLISEVSEDSPAEKAGLKAGDVIVAVNDEKVTDASDVSEIITDMKAGEKANLKILRNKSPMTVAVEVAERDQPDVMGSFTIPSIPDAPDAPTIRIPRMKGLYFGKESAESFDSDQFKKDMEKLKEEMKQLRENLKDLESRVK